MTASFRDQGAHDVRCEWGALGVEALVGCRTFIVVDVLSFSTCVAVAVERGAVLFPYGGGEPDAEAFARSRQALLAGPRWARTGYSLSPASFLAAPRGTRVVLPSPNGAVVSLAASGRANVLAGSLRNRTAICARARLLGGPFAVIPAGERWPDGSLRPAFEDLVGAGAIVERLEGSHSPEATAALAAFQSVSGSLRPALGACASGRELLERGFAEDVDLAAELDGGSAAAQLLEGAFVAPSSPAIDT